MKKLSVLNCPIDFDKTNFLHLLSLSAGYCLDCQNRMGELVIGDNGWSVDVENGTISFGEENVYQSGIIGSESDISGTWLWGWANTESGLPEMTFAPSRRALRKLPDMEEFKNGSFILDELRTGHNLAMVCCGVSDRNDGYYRCPYSDGALFVTVEDLPDEVFAPVATDVLFRQYLEILSSFYCDHMLLAAGYLYQNGYGFTISGNTLAARLGNNTAFFEYEKAGDVNRLINISF